ncbi:MAG: DUF309 domain-containing protein [Deltaproteobacteria bacterium]|nr:DUF309 domain-containing protein [Deltaproteobacteria bacterium]
MKPPRYSQQSLPPYRYLPTRDPHPGIHPEGHSYGKVEEKLTYIDPQDWKKNQAYLYGLDLFNHGYFWEAHEAWEAVWLTTKKFDAYGQYLQSLIQFSAALLKLYGGNKRGFDKLYGEAWRRMEFVLSQIKEENWMGLAIENWLKKMEKFFQASSDPQGKITDPLIRENFPFLKLET